MTARVQRRPARRPATVVVVRVAHVEGVDPDVLQALLLAAGVDHRWTGLRWEFSPADALAVAAALARTGLAVRLASGPLAPTDQTIREA